MKGWLADLALILLAGGVFAAATAAAVSLVWPVLAARLRGLAPVPRTWVALAAALAPVLVPAALVATCLMPGLGALFGAHSDHCLAHPEHPHLCLLHRSGALSAPLVALLLAAAAAASIVLARFCTQLARARRRGAVLERASAAQLAPGVTLVYSARPFSLAAGLLRPHVWISTALAEALAGEQLAAVIAHERAHVQRRDALCRWVAAACSLPLWPPVRRALLAELALAGEQACDEAAAVRVGDRLRVAETLLLVERLLGAAGRVEPIGVLAFGGSTVPERVRSLLAEPPAASSWRYAPLAAAGIALVAALGADRVHHATEHLLGALLRSF